LLVVGEIYGDFEVCFGFDWWYKFYERLMIDKYLVCRIEKMRPSGKVLPPCTVEKYAQVCG